MQSSPAAEAHHNYLDLQFLIYGEEKAGYSDYSNPKRNISEYDATKDIELFDLISNEVFLTLRKGMFVVFFPYEIHRMGIISSGKGSVRKAVFKILFCS
jgi:biofilm protein TabA